MSNTCPRRLMEPGNWSKEHGLDVSVDDVCPFCGSISGDAFMAALNHPELEVLPTDKNYKAYVRVKNPDGGPVTGVGFLPPITAQMKFYFQHLSSRQKYEFVELINGGTLQLGHPGFFYALPYFCKLVTTTQHSTLL